MQYLNGAVCCEFFCSLISPVIYRINMPHKKKIATQDLIAIKISDRAAFKLVLNIDSGHTENMR